MQNEGPEPAEVREQLSRIAISDPFQGKEALRKFLTFVVEQALAGRQRDIKESVVGVEVFSRPANYDTKRDPIVRNQAAKLRAALDTYYAAGGAHDPVRIEIVKGTYAPTFRYSYPPAANTAGAKSSAITNAAASKEQSRPFRSGLSAGIAIAAVAAAVIVTMLVFKSIGQRTGDHTAKPKVDSEKSRAEAQRLYEQAYQAFDNGQNQTAKLLMDRALQIRSDEAKLWHLRGMAQRRLDNLDDAISDFNRAISLSLDYPYSYYERGAAYDAKRDALKAIEDETRAIKLAGDDPAADKFFQERGTAYMRLGSRLNDDGLWDKAKRDFDEAIRRNPKNGWAFASRAEILLRRHQNQNAVADCNHALKLLPSSEHAWILNIRADAKQALGDARSALRDRELRKQLIEGAPAK